MKTVFLDTNVVIDLLDKREGFYPAAVKLFTLAYKGELSLYISPLTYATAAYILRKHPVEKLRFLDKWQSIQGYSSKYRLFLNRYS